MPQSVADQQTIEDTLPLQQSAKVAESLEYAENLCRANNARLTPIRRLVLEALLEINGPIGAYDLASFITAQGRDMPPITVYRALDFLMEQGLVYRLASLNAFIARPKSSNSSQATIFLICEKCGDVNDVSSPELFESLSKLQKSHSFTPLNKVLELTGCCSRC